MKEAKTSKFSIKSLMKGSSPKLDSVPLAEQNVAQALMPPLIPTGLAANQLMFNMALSSLHEKFLESVRQRGGVYGQSHPAYAGVLATSLPGFVTAHSSTMPRPRLEFMQECQNQSWMIPSPKRHHSSLHHPGFDYARGILSLNKPKRIRTAFSPNQLVQLEAAFDNNPYVVGQERRDLAIRLGLTETQVKVWFQNRRTKQKRGKPDSEVVLEVNE